MKTFKIISSAGVDMGTYQGDSPAGALDAMARDAGYADQRDATAVAGPFEGVVMRVDACPVCGQPMAYGGVVTCGKTSCEAWADDVDDSPSDVDDSPSLVRNIDYIDRFGDEG